MGCSIHPTGAMGCRNCNAAGKARQLRAQAEEARLQAMEANLAAINARLDAIEARMIGRRRALGEEGE
jgi:hypothetical protein